jgi:transcriptional regulator with XRE-family HTH domain
MKLRDQVGLNIQELRHIRGISQEDLAHLAGVNRGYIGKLENAKYSATLDMIEKIAEALEIAPSVLLATRDFSHPEFASNVNDQSFEQMTKSTASDKNPNRIIRRLKAKPLQEGVISTKKGVVVVWKDYTWNTGEISRYWTLGFEAVPDNIITVRKIRAEQKPDD